MQINNDKHLESKLNHEFRSHKCSNKPSLANVWYQQLSIGSTVTRKVHKFTQLLHTYLLVCDTHNVQHSGQDISFLIIHQHLPVVNNMMVFTEFFL